VIILNIKDKLELSADIVMSVLANSTADVKTRLDLAPKALEDVFNKVDEIVKNNNDEVQNTDIYVDVI